MFTGELSFLIIFLSESLFCFHQENMENLNGKILTEKSEDLHKLAKALLDYETLSGEEIKDLILKNTQPKRKDEEKDKDTDQSSVLGSLGLKPKPEPAT